MQAKRASAPQGLEFGPEGPEILVHLNFGKTRILALTEGFITSRIDMARRTTCLHALKKAMSIPLHIETLELHTFLLNPACSFDSPYTLYKGYF